MFAKRRRQSTTPSVAAAVDDDDSTISSRFRPFKHSEPPHIRTYTRGHSQEVSESRYIAAEDAVNVLNHPPSFPRGYRLHLLNFL